MGDLPKAADAGGSTIPRNACWRDPKAAPEAELPAAVKRVNMWNSQCRQRYLASTSHLEVRSSLVKILILFLDKV